MAGKKKLPTKVTDLIQDDKNFNLGNPFGEGLIEKSFQKFGAGRSILLDKNNRIIAGNKSTEKFAAGGGEKIITIETDGKTLVAVKRTDIDLDTPEGREMALADNAAAKANIVFDAAVVEAELGEAVCEEWGIELPENEVTEDGFDAEPPLKPITVLGDLYVLDGNHRVLCGDSTDSDTVAKLMDGKLPNMTWSDPPYNALKSWNKSESRGETRLGPSKWFENDNMSWEDYAAFLLAFTSLNKSDVVYVCCDFRVYEHIKFALIKNGYKIKHCIVWKKNVWGLGKKYRFQHEFIIYAELNNAKFYGDRSQSDVWEANVVKDGSHNTPKPVELPARAIKNSSLKNCIVYDPFLGSGTGLIASDQLDRMCYGMELGAGNCDLTIARYIKFKQSQSSETAITILRNGKELSPKDIQKYLAQIEPKDGKDKTK